MTKTLTYNEKFISLNKGHSFHIVRLMPNKQNVECNYCHICETVATKIKRDDGINITLCTHCAEEILHFTIPHLIQVQVRDKHLTLDTIPLENDTVSEDAEFHIKEPILNFLRKI